MGFGSVRSQNSIYIFPSINNKFGVSSTNGFFRFSKNFPENEHFAIYNKSIHYAPGIRLGLGIGWENEKHRFSLDFTWNQDAATIRNERFYYLQTVKIITISTTICPIALALFQIGSLLT